MKGRKPIVVVALVEGSVVAVAKPPKEAITFGFT